MANQQKTEPNTKNLYQRIRAVMEDVEYLQKDKEVSTGGAGSYKALSEETVTKNVREAMIRHGLVILPIGQEHHLVDHVRGPGKVVSLTTVNTQYKIVNVDNPTEFEILASSGTGVDSQDKGVGKAMTYSYKYLLLRTFGIATGRDADSVGNAELEREQALAAQKAIDAAILLLEGATTEKELKQVGVKDYMTDPKYKAAALAANNRIKAAEANALATETAAPPVAAEKSGEAKPEAKAMKAVPTEPEHPGTEISDAEAPAQPAVAYATAAQKEEIIRLLNHPVITRQEKTKMLLNVNRLDEDKAASAIAKLKKAIEDRENGESAAA
ncbi:ERF family protein [Hymenobacter metallicola]|uniref:Single-stranded DNA-binding protein n=1 Tax=Hymenobacter metallicola TaxID=2563114 RepID=A0A4Z0QL37_9BACT|nr:ERF family protein [Hymenobacter metallicola]TGE29761.1 hypothetical protein E5K02_09965 [Hymenobacter metallicola]